MGEEAFEAAVPFIFAAFTGDFFLEWCLLRGYHNGYSWGDEQSCQNCHSAELLLFKGSGYVHPFSVFFSTTSSMRLGCCVLRIVVSKLNEETHEVVKSIVGLMALGGTRTLATLTQKPLASRLVTTEILCPGVVPVNGVKVSNSALGQRFRT